MSRLIKGSHPPRKTVQMQNLSSPKAGSNQGVRKKKKVFILEGMSCRWLITQRTMLLRSHAGIEGKSRKQGWVWSSWWQTASSPGRSLDKAVPGKRKLFPETLPETGKLREGEKGFSSPSSMSPSDASVSHWSIPARTIWDPGNTACEPIFSW